MSIEVSVDNMMPAQLAVLNKQKEEEIALRKKETLKLQIYQVNCIGYYGSRGNIPEHMFVTPEKPVLGKMYMCHKCNELVEDDKKPRTVEIKYKRA